MECEEVLNRLWEYLDQELGPEEAKAVGEHLHDCPTCHPSYCCDRALLELLARLRANCSIPPSCLASIRARLGLR